MSKDSQSKLFERAPQPPGVVAVNEAITLREEDGFTVVLINEVPWHRFPSDSDLDWRLAGASLVVSGAAHASEVLSPLKLSRATLHRDRGILLAQGIRGLAARKRGPKGPTKATADVKRRVLRLRAARMPLAAIAQTVGVSLSTVSRLLDQEDQAAAAARQTKLPFSDAAPPTGTAAIPAALPGGESPPAPPPEPVAGGLPPAGASAPSAAPAAVEPAPAAMPGGAAAATEDVSAFTPVVPHPPVSHEGDLDRGAERVLARFGRITEATVRFVSGRGLQYVGALLLIPALVQAGFFGGLESVYGKLKNGFYGLRHTVMTLALMMALRRPRAEHLRGACPAAIGRLLGLDRAPEVKTLRRRVREIADRGKAGAWMTWMAGRLAHRNPEEWAFLYVDGHVRAYFGSRRIGKAYVTQRRLAMPGATDFWVNGTHGEPLLVVTGEVRPALTDALLPILRQVRELLGPTARVTVAFDRGGWCLKLFREIVKLKFDFLTYRKGHRPRYSRGDFVEQKAVLDGRAVSYLLRERAPRTRWGMRLRSIIRLRDDGRQTSIVTTRTDLPGVEAAYRLFERWRQENYFKYMSEEFDLDALDSYAIESDDGERTVPNPERARIAERAAELRRRIHEVEAELGRALETNREGQRRTVRGLKVATTTLRRRLKMFRRMLTEAQAEAKRTPKRITLAARAGKGKVPIKLEVETKHFLNVLKMAVYRAESALFLALERHFAPWAKEGRALLREAFTTSGDLEVAGGELRVTLNPLSAPCRSQAIAGLCNEINLTRTRIPGTSLMLRFAVRGHETSQIG